LEDNLNARKLSILRSAIEDYIQDAQPITSGAVHKRHLKDISSATLRNELNTLEAMGYLKQLHTSGGRIPTTKAYRLYVNELMNQADFDIKSLEVIRSMFETRTSSLEEIVKIIAGTISKATNYPAVVVLNGFEKLSINNVKIIPVIGNKAIVLITTSTGIINNTIDINEHITETVCNDAGRFLTQHFKGRTISDMILNIKTFEENMSAELSEYKNIFHILCDSLYDLSSSSKFRMSTQGTIKLLNNPEYKDFDVAKKVIHLLEDEEELKQIFTKNSAFGGVTFKIGTENEHKDLSDCGVITANYTVNGNNVASIKVIGPKRMNYSKVAGVLRYIVGELAIIKQLPTNFDDKK
jgi:heat-inducible transcriptional repressor